VNTTLYLFAAYAVGLGILLAYAISLWAQLGKTKDSSGGDGGRP
jgi:hypothetical protein